MKYTSLLDLIEKIKSSPRVKGIFITGSGVSGISPSSDIDLVILLDRNSENIKCVYVMIENHFSDIFFFDREFLEQLKNKNEVSANDFDGMFIEWIRKGKVEYDPENLLSQLKNKIIENPPLQNVADSEKREFWVKTNYNFIANMRYYNSGEEFYHKALEIRLLYSVIELITAYFAFRNIPWRGEKAAVSYLEQNDREFLSVFQRYSRSNTLEGKMKYYQELFNKIFFGEYQRWKPDFVVAIPNKNGYDPKLLSFWEQLVG